MSISWSHIKSSSSNNYFFDPSTSWSFKTMYICTLSSASDDHRVKGRRMLSNITMNNKLFDPTFSQFCNHLERDPLTHIKANLLDFLLKFDAFIKRLDEELFNTFLQVYNFVCRANSFQILEKIPSHKVIDRCLLQVTSQETGFLFEEAIQMNL